MLPFNASTEEQCIASLKMYEDKKYPPLGYIQNELKMVDEISGILYKNP